MRDINKGADLINNRDGHRQFGFSVEFGIDMNVLFGIHKNARRIIIYVSFRAKPIEFGKAGLMWSTTALVRISANSHIGILNHLTLFFIVGALGANASREHWSVFRC